MKKLVKGLIYATAIGIGTANTIHNYNMLVDHIDETDSRLEAFLRGCSTGLSVYGANMFLILAAAVYAKKLDNPIVHLDIVL